MTVLAARDLSVHFGSGSAAVRAVDHVSFEVAAGERFAIVGESGSGKSTLAMSLLRLIRPPGRIAGGAIELEGTDILGLDEERMRRLRLSRIALVPQGAMNSLNPVMRVGDQIRDALEDHDLAGSDWRARVDHLLEAVGLDPSASRRFPHELSGGMKQRVAIAIAISGHPSVLVADEPTSALDVVVQRQVLQTLARVRRELRAAVVLVGHDMGLIAQFADRVGVMYAGRLVEVGPVRDVLRAPRHPYSRRLISSVPTLDTRLERLTGIPGMQPALADLPAGCAFHPRCSEAIAACLDKKPALITAGPAHQVACHLQEPTS